MTWISHFLKGSVSLFQHCHPGERNSSNFTKDPSWSICDNHPKTNCCSGSNSNSSGSNSGNGSDNGSGNGSGGSSNDSNWSGADVRVEPPCLGPTASATPQQPAKLD